jgi:signal peptidase I
MPTKLKTRLSRINSWRSLMSDAPKPTQEKHGLVRFWRETLRPLFVLIVLLTSFRSAIADWNDVPSGSMQPTIVEGDRVFVNRVAYDLKVPFTTWHLARWADPERGDIVVLVSPVDGRRLIKRVVGIPGDVLELRGQRLTVNGEAASYEPLEIGEASARGTAFLPVAAMARETVAGRSHMVLSQSASGQGSDLGPLRVPEGKYFLMGDHRDSSFDSRFWGFADRGAILGRAVGIAFSLDHDHHLTPRWERLAAPLD